MNHLMQDYYLILPQAQESYLIFDIIYHPFLTKINLFYKDLFNEKYVLVLRKVMINYLLFILSIFILYFIKFSKPKPLNISFC